MVNAFFARAILDLVSFSQDSSRIIRPQDSLSAILDLIVYPQERSISASSTSSRRWLGSAGETVLYVGECLSVQVMKTGLNNTVNNTHVVKVKCEN